MTDLTAGGPRYSFRYVRYAVHGSAHCEILTLRHPCETGPCLRAKIRHYRNIGVPLPLAKTVFRQGCDKR